MSQGPDLRGYIPDITTLGLPYTAETIDDATKTIYEIALDPKKVYVVEGTIGGYATDESDFITASFQLGGVLTAGLVELVAESTPFKKRSNNAIDIIYPSNGDTTFKVQVKGLLGTTMKWSGTIKVTVADAN